MAAAPRVLESRQRRVDWRGLTLALVAVLVAPDGHRPSTAAARPALEVVDLHWEPVQWGVKSVGGWVRNNTDHPFDRVAVAIEYSDGSGRALGVCELRLEALGPYERRKFSPWLLPGGPRSYRVTRLTGI